MIYAHSRVNPNDVQVVSLKHPDLLATLIQLDGQPDPLLLCNVYNPPSTCDTIPPLTLVLEEYQSPHRAVVGDLNVHHPLWESDPR